MAQQQDIEVPIWRGDTVEIPFIIDDAGLPVSLEGATVIFTLKLDPYTLDEDAPYKYEAVVPNPDAEGALGEHTIVIDQGDTQALELTKYIYQIKVIFPGPPVTEITYVWGHVPVGDS